MRKPVEQVEIGDVVVLHSANKGVVDISYVADKLVTLKFEDGSTNWWNWGDYISVED